MHDWYNSVKKKLSRNENSTKETVTWARKLIEYFEQHICSLVGFFDKGIAQHYHHILWGKKMLK